MGGSGGACTPDRQSKSLFTNLPPSPAPRKNLLFLLFLLLFFTRLYSCSSPSFVLAPQRVTSPIVPSTFEIVSAAVGLGPDINPASLSAAAAAVTPELVAEEATGSSGYLLPVHSGVQRTNRAVCRCQISKVAHEAEADVRKAPSGTPPELREARQLEKSEEPRRAESHRKSTRRKSRRCARSSEAAEHQTRR